MNTPTPHGETPQAALLRRGNDYAEFERQREERERVEPGSRWSCREDLWLNDRLPEGSVSARFAIYKMQDGEFYKMRCYDRLTGKTQDFRAGEWGFMEAWMSDQQEVRS